jgi:hypothetical protein
MRAAVAGLSASHPPIRLKGFIPQPAHDFCCRFAAEAADRFSSLNLWLQNAIPAWVIADAVMTVTCDDQTAEAQSAQVSGEGRL